MNRLDTAIPEVCIIEVDRYTDARGYFMEAYNQREFARLGITDVFVQDNQSFSKAKHSIRGIHFQMNPMAQSKLVQVQSGAVMDLAVDLRRGSPTYLKWVAAELTADNNRMLYVPRGFGHGFLTLTDNVLFRYKVDAFYSASCDRSIRYDDPQIAVNWECAHPLLSEKDADAPYLMHSDCNFVYE
ncbi:MAG: dTDP-4-dehydrorhamnose 3,5-epimerase [Firmicutes bacterium]|nr:dTDP-4-dehydrorhamnose 3,5-epimerase [Bacillota bacterium]